MSNSNTRAPLSRSPAEGVEVNEATANALVRRGLERALEKLKIAGYGDFQAIVEDSPYYHPATIDELVEDLLLEKVGVWLDSEE